MPLRIWVIGTRTSSAPSGKAIDGPAFAAGAAARAIGADAAVADSGADAGAAGAGGSGGGAAASALESVGSAFDSGPSAGAEGAADAAAGAAVAAAVAPPASSMTAISALFGTVAPSSTRISLRTPSNGDGTSALTLSVMTSSSGSYLATWSPGFLSHVPIVPSATLSPSLAVVTFATWLPSDRACPASLPHLPRP